MDPTPGPTPETTPPKIKEPRRKLNADAKEVYNILSVPHGKKLEIQEIYKKHKLDQYDLPYREIPKEPLESAKEDLQNAFPDLFEKCESPWFANWAFFRRHKANQERLSKLGKSGNDNNDGEQSADGLEQQEQQEQ